jgi:hypothetical protein
MGERNPKGRIHIKRLRFGRRVRAGCRVTAMRDTNVSSEALHMTREKYVFNKAVIFPQVYETIVVAGKNSRSVLAPMLKNS